MPQASRSRARRRLDHQRKADSPRKLKHLVLGRGQNVAGTRHAGPAEDFLHAGLVAEVPGHLESHTRDAEGLPDLRQRLLELLQRTEQPPARADPVGEISQSPGDLAGVQRVFDFAVRGQLGPQVWPKLLGRILADQTEPDSVQIRGGVDEPQGRLGEERRYEHDRLHAGSP